MGNPLLKNYNIEKDHFLTGGFNNLWKIYKGSRKDRKQDVCIFVLEKKVLDKFPQEEREEILNSLKKEAAALVKFKHPSILSIYEQVLEDKQSLIFVTEPIQYTLSSWIETSGASKLEIKLMITEVCHVLNFLHDDAHVIHGSLNPENIFIDTQGHIKLSGLGFSLSDPPISGIECQLNFSLQNSIPNLSYIAPEIVNEQIANYQSDIFSMGVIIYNILKKYKNEEKEKELLNLNSNNSVSSYNRAYEALSKIVNKLSFECDDNDVIKRAVNKTVQNRPKIKEYLEHAWFNDPKLKALRFVENLETNEANKNNEFLNKFPQILGFFEPKIIERRFIPALMNALKVETLIVSSLPAIFCICESQNIKIDFEHTVWPGLKQLFQMKQLPAAALFYILSKLNFLSEKISNSEFAANMLNIICKALDCNVPKIQSIVMENISFVIKKIDSLAFKNQIYPRLVNVLLNTNSHSLKLLILKSFTTIYSLLDHTIINESLLVNLEKVRKSDNSGEVCICLANIYEEIAKIVSIESIANKILPNLISILLSGNISKGSFENIMLLVQKYLTRIKESREKDLTDDVGLSKTKQETKDTSNLISVSSSKGNEKDDFSFLNSFFGINNSAANPNSSTSNIITTSEMDTRNPFDFDFTSQMAKSNTETTNSFSGFKKPSQTNEIFPETLAKAKTNKSLFDGLNDKESSSKINQKSANDNILDSFGFSQFTMNENVTKPQTNLTRNSNLDGFNFNMNNTVNTNNPSIATNKPQSKALNLNKKTMEDEFKGYEVTKPQNNPNTLGNINKTKMLDSFLDEIAPTGKEQAIITPSASTGNNMNDWSFNFNNTPTTNKPENNINNNKITPGMNLNMNGPTNNKDNFGFTYDFTNQNSNSFGVMANNQTKNVGGEFDFDFGIGNNNNTAKSITNNNFNSNFNNSNSLNKNKQSNSNPIPGNDPFVGLNLTPTSNNKQTDTTKNLLDGLLKF